MEEITRILATYDESRVPEAFTDLEHINGFALRFYRDVAEIYDCVTRIKNIERNPTGYSLDDAPILGLLVRTWKLFKEVIRYYEIDNAEIISILERPMLESAVVATYLLRASPGVLEDYRKCSYKDRLRMLSDLRAGSPFFATKAGQRVISSIRRKMEFEKLTETDFAEQKARRWRLQGKSFYQIFSDVAHADLYTATYGMMSESIHGSWNESMDWCLAKNEDGTFSTFPFNHPADVRFISPVIKFTNEPYRLWLQRIDANDDNLRGTLDWIERVNSALFRQFDAKFDE